MPQAAAIFAPVSTQRCKGLVNTAAGVQLAAMRLASASASARPRSVSASSARPRKRAGRMPSTWP
jgi:hypothetical protein